EEAEVIVPHVGIGLGRRDRIRVGQQPGLIGTPSRPIKISQLRGAGDREVCQGKGERARRREYVRRCNINAQIGRVQVAVQTKVLRSISRTKGDGYTRRRRYLVACSPSQAAVAGYKVRSISGPAAEP